MHLEVGEHGRDPVSGQVVRGHRHETAAALARLPASVEQRAYRNVQLAVRHWRPRCLPELYDRHSKATSRDRMTWQVRIRVACFHMLIMLMCLVNVDIVVLDSVYMDHIVIVIRVVVESLAVARLVPRVAFDLELIFLIEVSHKFIVLLLFKSIPALPASTLVRLGFHCFWERDDAPWRGTDCKEYRAPLIGVLVWVGDSPDLLAFFEPLYLDVLVSLLLARRFRTFFVLTLLLRVRLIFWFLALLVVLVLIGGVIIIFSELPRVLLVEDGEVLLCEVGILCVEGVRLQGLLVLLQLVYVAVDLILLLLQILNYLLQPQLLLS